MTGWFDLSFNSLFIDGFFLSKYLIVETLRELGYSVGMTGDGVNDAPALKRADVGIAVAGATDAARAAAAIVLTEEGLSTIIHGIVIAREIFSRISNFITYRVRFRAFDPHEIVLPSCSLLQSSSLCADFCNSSVALLLLHCHLCFPPS
jgi:hypothetical protein